VRTGSVTLTPPSQLRPLAQPQSVRPQPAAQPLHRLPAQAPVARPDQLQLLNPLTASQPVKSANLFADLNAPRTRTPEDYQQIFNWVEKVTGAPIAYQNARSQAAYLEAIQGKPQEHFDTQGFLHKLGVHGAETYGRDDRGVHKLVKSLDGFEPHSHHVSKPLQIAQKTFFWFFKSFPKTFDRLANVADKYYFTRKDTKAQTWLNVQVPQPGISPTEPILPADQVRQAYRGNLISAHLQKGQRLSTEQLFEAYFSHNPPKEIGLLFENDFHKGVPKPGETPQNYGTYAIARQLGFSHQQATFLGTANYDMDLNNTIYGDTDAFPNAKPSRHFNLNKANPAAGDTRFIWAQKHLDAAVELARRGRFEQAERELGYGLHSIQDSFAHGHIRLASHAVTGQIPDGVPYNPVGAYEATLATIGYLKAYIERLEKL